jgi:predicted phage terminase large subunit-like protein
MQPKVDYSLNLSDMVIEFKNGGIIYLCTAESPDRLRGINAHDGLIDEIGSLPTSEAYDILVGRTRESEDSQRRLIGTPTARPWLKDLILRNPESVIRQTTLENKFLPLSYIEDLKKTYGEGSAWYRQEILGEIVDFSTGIIDADKFVIVDKRTPRIGRTVRAWDFAHSDSKRSDYTASAMMSTDGSKSIIHDITRFKGAYSKIREQVIATMIMDGPDVVQYIEDTLGGKVIISDLSMDQRLRQISIMPCSAVRDKVSRALPMSSRASQGLIMICKGENIKLFLDECRTFGDGSAHDDMVDAVAHAYNQLITTSQVKSGIIRGLY